VPEGAVRAPFPEGESWDKGEPINTHYFFPPEFCDFSKSSGAVLSSRDQRGAILQELFKRLELEQKDGEGRVPA